MQISVSRRTLLLAAGLLVFAAAVVFFEDRLIGLLENAILGKVPAAEPAQEVLPDFSKLPRPAELPSEGQDTPVWTTLEGAGPEGGDLRALKLGANSAKYLFNPAVGEVRFIHNVKNAGPGPLEYVNLYALYPSDLERQDIIDLAFSPGSEQLIEDNRGQPIVAYEFENVAPETTVETLWRARVRTWDLYYDIDPGDVGPLREVPEEIASEFLADEDILRVTHPTITKARDDALQSETNPLMMARRIFDWVRDNVEYEIEGGWEDAVTVIERGSGSCSEYAFVFTALCRSAGLPARWTGALARGGPASGPGPYPDYSHHRWVEVYLPRIGWVHCDAAGGTWGYIPNSYLIISQSSGPSDRMGLDYDASCEWSFGDGSGKVLRDRYALWYADPDTVYIEQ
jgi:hypothetical protein